MKRTALILFMLAWPASLLAQGSTFHVFPQVADGKLSDGTVYRSILSVANLNGNAATCTLSTSSGLPLERFQVSAPRNMAAYTSNINFTKGSDPFASGYATLSCTQPVQASLMYVEAAPNGSSIGMASVFSAPPVTYASALLLTGGLQYGVALANTSAAAIAVTFTVNRTDGTNTSMVVQVPAQSQFVHFVSDVVTLPSTPGLINLEISSDSRFNITALLYDGPVFTTIIPAMLP